MMRVSLDHATLQLMKVATVRAWAGKVLCTTKEVQYVEQINSYHSYINTSYIMKPIIHTSVSHSTLTV